MPTPLLLLNLLLDHSGSMKSIAPAMVSGFNEFVEAQRDAPGEMLFTFCTFEAPGHFQVRQKLVEPGKIELLHPDTYRPNGASTALYDGIMEFLDTVEEIYAVADLNHPDAELDVINVIMTDGQENSSAKYTNEMAFNRIKESQDAKEWNMVYLGANQDAYAVGAGIGTQRGSTRTYAATQGGTKSALGAVTNSVSAYRSSRASGQSLNSYNPDLLAGTPDVLTGEDEDEK